MLRLLLFAGVLGGTAIARAEPAGPVRVAVQCEDSGRTKMCPAFLLGYIDANKVLLNSPRSAADVVVYATATEISLVDRVHLRFVSSMPGAPSAVEVDVELDTRATDDAQRAQLEPAFLRGIALYVGARHPGAVTVALTAPAELTATKVKTTPWGFEVGGDGNANYTAKYRSASFDAHFVARYITRRFRALTLESASGGLNRQPPLMLDDGTVASLDSNQWAFRGGAEGIYSWCDRWSFGVGSYTSFEDPKAQYKYNSRSRAAVEWDMFAPDDPRGNRLAVFYHLGWEVDRYNLRNELGERFAQFPVHGINALGSVRHDKVQFGLQLESDVQLDHPGRRHSLTAAPFMTVQLGTHIDLSLSMSITQRALPAPDPAAIDPSDYAQLSRLSYAEPLSLTGSIGITVHWDPTNGVRNDRIESI